MGIRIFLFIAMVFAAHGSASAVAILDLTGTACHNNAACDVSLTGTGSDSITASFSAPDVMFGTNDFFGSDNGLIFGSPFFPRSFDLSFDSTLLWTGGTIGQSFQFSGFDVTGPGVTQTSVLTQPQPGTFLLDTALTFRADQSYRFEAISTSPISLASLRDLSFLPIAQANDLSVIPVPAGLPLLLTGLVFFGWLARRRRTAPEA
ncbi:MAG: VPLPA-CTERM sorting domain-containing protein [Pseudomonadota bacterium]